MIGIDGTETFAKIKVIGVGGAGTNTVDNMIESGIHGVEFIAINTDEHHLLDSEAPTKYAIGQEITRGLGAGMDPEIGRLAAEESINELKDILEGADMVILTLGEGGGTGTGAAPVIARLAKRELGILTVAVATMPFKSEGKARMRKATSGLEELKAEVDAISIVNNELLLKECDDNVSFPDALSLSDDALRQVVTAISEVASRHGKVHVDMADVRATLKDKGTLFVGIGEASGSDRAIKAIQKAITSPLIESSIDGATNCISIFYGPEELLGMREVLNAQEIVNELVHDEAEAKFGVVYDDTLGDMIRVVIIAAGFEENNKKNSGTNISGRNEAPKTIQTGTSSIIPSAQLDFETGALKYENNRASDFEANVNPFGPTSSPSGKTLGEEGDPLGLEPLSGSHNIWSSSSNPVVSGTDTILPTSSGSISSVYTTTGSNLSVNTSFDDDDLDLPDFIK